MPFELEKVVPWGRSFEEYASIFSLTINDLNKEILGCSDGPASFNIEMKRNGRVCTSVDPIYQFTDVEIKKRITESFDEVLSQTRKNKNEFIWKNIKSVEELGKTRKNAMEQFLADFELGKKENRYIAGALPRLNLKNQQFDLALCSHFLLFSVCPELFHKTLKNYQPEYLQIRQAYLAGRYRFYDARVNQDGR
ncbi:MAG: hypothetical protein JJV92_05280 [Desulfosarcina sp.]|nr:hypothetical protein [Desulfobacterales bacterium]